MCVSWLASCGPYESAKEMANYTAAMAEHCDAVVILTCDFDPDQQGDQAWKENCSAFIDELPPRSVGATQMSSPCMLCTSCRRLAVSTYAHARLPCRA